jgi:trypsin
MNVKFSGMLSTSLIFLTTQTVVYASSLNLQNEKNLLFENKNEGQKEIVAANDELFQASVDGIQSYHKTQQIHEPQSEPIQDAAEDSAKGDFVQTIHERFTQERDARMLRNDDNNDVGNLEKIVGGVEVSPKFKYPYMVYAFGCGASLVAPNILLSAAHCGQLGAVQIGRHNLNNATENYEAFSVVESAVHPQFNPQTLDYDYQMVRLSGVSSFTPVELDRGDISLDAGKDVVVMGWGTTASGGFTSKSLLEVEVDLWSASSCKSAYSESGITERMVCAARIGKDSCQGDSGGPIIDKETGKQIGIVSWGIGCAEPEYPGVYAKVQDQIEWIEKYIKLWNEPTPAPLPCTNDSNFVDSYGDGCDWYEENEDEGCPVWGGCCDFGLGTANEACCHCGGGITLTSSPTGPPVPPTSPPTATPTPPPTVAPTPPQTLAPTPSPVQTQSPTSYPSFIPTRTNDITCFDNPERFMITKPNGEQKMRSCNWVKRLSTAWRCANVEGAKENCPLTCTNCCQDSEEKFKLLFNGAEKSCAWVRRKNTIVRCAKPPVRQKCGATCGSCD